MKRLVLILAVILMISMGLTIFSCRQKNNETNSGSSENNPIIPVAPATPTNLTAIAISSYQINLAWTDNSNNEQGFKIWRKTGATGNYETIFLTTTNIISYSDFSVLPTTDYFYKVQAYDSTKDSGFSNEVLITTPDIPPNAPSNCLAIIILNPNSKIDLSWIDNSYNEDGFIIERKISISGTYEVITQVGADTSSCSDIKLNASTQYYYRVKAFNEIGDSNYSNEAEATTGQWIIETVSNENDYVELGKSSTIDSLGNIHVAYDGGKMLKYAVKKSGTWQTTIVNPNDEPINISIATDANNKAHIAYYAYNRNCLVYATNATPDNNWQIKDIDFGLQPDILIKDETIYISYYSNMLKLATKKLSDADWKIYLINGNNVGTGSSMGFDSENTMYIAYSSGDTSKPFLQVATKAVSATNWTITEIQKNSYGSDLTIDSNNKAYIVYVEGLSDGRNMLKLATKTISESAWTIIGITDGPIYTSYVYYYSISVDSAGKVYIALVDAFNSLHLITYENNAWGGFTDLDNTGTTINGLGGLNIDSNDKLNITYINNSKLKYITNR